MQKKTDKENSKNTEETSEQPKQTEKRKPKPVPREPTRTSIRERRPPIKYEDYKMNMMVTEMHNTDYRLKALNVLVNSGVFDELNSEVVKIIINAVMQ